MIPDPKRQSASPPRPVYMVLSPRALPYAQLAIASLLEHSLDPLSLHLITDSGADKQTLSDAPGAFADAGRHSIAVWSQDDLDAREAERFAEYPNLRALRRGHPCWRKISDPLLVTEPGDEMVLLDPDLYFPNYFRFERTPATGLLMMWQRPNCLLPDEAVELALEAGIPLADHVDIGVAQWRGCDLSWLDGMIGKLKVERFPFSMHIEAIVWAAIAMHIGGGHLDPRCWVCWHRTQIKRVAMRLNIPGERLLRVENLRAAKCFHAGGEAKQWLAPAKEAGLFDAVSMLDAPSPLLRYKRLQPIVYRREQRLKGWLRRTQYYRLLGG